MTSLPYDRDKLADFYAKQHLLADPSISDVFYLPNQSPNRDIRLVEINTWAGDSIHQTLEPVDFAVDFGTELEHTLRVVDVTPAEWQSVLTGELKLPDDWSLDGRIHYGKDKHVETAAV
ncbi:hypothetical protein [Lacunimicrobium album]